MAEPTAMKSKRRVLEVEDNNTEIKRFLCSAENQSRPDDGRTKGLASGLVIKSFYGSNSKCSYLNPLERKASRENDGLASLQATRQMKETSKSSKEAIAGKSINQLFSSQGKPERKRVKTNTGSTVRKFENIKNGEQKSTKPSTNTQSLDSSHAKTDSKYSSSDNLNCASRNSVANKFFCNRSPRKLALLSRRGPAVLINRGFSVKFQLRPGPKLQKPQQKEMVLPKIPSLVQVNRLDQPDTDENQNLSSKDQTVTEDEQLVNEQQQINSDEAATASIVASSTFQNPAAPTPMITEKSSSIVETSVETEPQSELNASVSDLFALSETSEMSSSQSDFRDDKKSPQHKLFPVFGADFPDIRSSRKKTLGTVSKGSLGQTKSSSRPKKTDKDQMILDFGQKLIGSVPCSVCGMTYLHGDGADEMMHNRFHQRLLNALKFTGWQKERVVQDFLDGSRVLMIVPDDKFFLKKLEAIKNIVDEDLGFVVDETLNSLWKAFLFVREKKVVGFCLAQSISHGYRMLADSQSQESLSDRKRPFCCDDKPESVRCGISRIWVLASERRKHIATKLLDVVRIQFLMGYPLSKEEIAFSDPTPDGIKFASKYTKTPCFLVFRK